MIIHILYNVYYILSFWFYHIKSYFWKILLDILFGKNTKFVYGLKGWLYKEVKNSPKMSSLKLKKRWFVLTYNSLDYYKNSEKNAMKLGTLVLNSLCSVVQPEEKIFKETGKICLIYFPFLPSSTAYCL